MSLLETLKKDALEARKNKTEHATFLVMVLSDITTAAKADGNRLPNDADAEKVAKSAVKKLDATLADERYKGTDFAAQAQSQRDVLAAYLPESLDESVLRTAIVSAAESLELAVEMKSMGKIMGVLNAQYPGQIDGAKVRQLLADGV